MQGSGRARRRVRVIDQVPDARPRLRARPLQPAKRSHVIDTRPDVAGPPKKKPRRSPMLQVIPDGWSPVPGVPDRSECKGGERPCRHTECPMHTWVIASEDREGRPHNGQRPPAVIRPYSPISCAQDVADRARARGEQVPAEVIGNILGFSERNARYYLKRAEVKLKAMGVELRALLLELLEEETAPVMAEGCRWVSQRGNAGAGRAA